jgi:hypothetical protein
MDFNFNTYETFFGWLFILISIFYAFKFRKHLKHSAVFIAPITLLGLILALSMSAFYTLHEITLNLNLYFIKTNVYLVVRNSFCATIGLCFFSTLSLQRPVGHWEDLQTTFKNLPFKKIYGIILLSLLFSFWLLNVFSDINLVRHQYNIMELCSEFLSDSTAALVEELLDRVFLIGYLLFLFQKSNHRSVIAIVVSTLYWSYLHVDLNNALGILKAVQVFPIGIGLGYLFLYYGFESALFTHILFNLSTLLLFNKY